MAKSFGTRSAAPYLAGGPRPRVLAHRGFVEPELVGRIAENTHASIAAAIDLGADYVETDCHLTRDGRVVLFHDADLARVLGDSRAIAEVGFAELSALMADRGGLLALDEALEAFPDTRFNIDVKAAAAAEPMGSIVAPHGARVLLTSFSDEYRTVALRAAEATPGGVRPATSPGRAALVRVLLAVASRSGARIARALDGLDALQIPERQGLVKVLSKRLIDAAHEHGVEVHVWTVNDAHAMVRLAQLGVDGIVTDRADIALNVLRPYRRSAR